MPESAEEVRARLRARIAAIEAGNGVPDGPEVDRCYGGASSQEGERPTRVGVVSRSASSVRVKGNVRGSAECDALDEGDASCSVDVAEEAERAFRKIERLAAMREQASTLLRTRLVREGFSADAVEQALVRALACGLVDDVRYAEVLVRSRVSQGCGAQGIAAELDGLGIDIACVPGWPDEFPVEHDDEVARALALLERKPPRAKNRRDAAYRRLSQKGFGASVASTAARLWSESLEE